MGFLTEIDVPERRTDRKNCPGCGGTAAGCRAVEWLSGRFCCEACTGNHDKETNR